MFISLLNWSAFGISIASYLGDLIPVLKDHQLITAALALLVFFIIGYIGTEAFTKVLGYPQIRGAGPVHRLWHHQGAGRRV